MSEERLYTTHEVCTLLGYSRSWVHLMIASGVLHALVLPGKGERKTYRVRESDLNRYLGIPRKEPS